MKKSLSAVVRSLQRTGYEGAKRNTRNRIFFLSSLSFFVHSLQQPSREESSDITESSTFKEVYAKITESTDQRKNDDEKNGRNRRENRSTSFYDPCEYIKYTTHATTVIAAPDPNPAVVHALLGRNIHPFFSTTASSLASPGKAFVGSSVTRRPRSERVRREFSW